MWINYGKKSNSEWLNDYGFVYENNFHNAFRFSMHPFFSYQPRCIPLFHLDYLYYSQLKYYLFDIQPNQIDEGDPHPILKENTGDKLMNSRNDDSDHTNKNKNNLINHSFDNLTYDNNEKNNNEEKDDGDRVSDQLININDRLQICFDFTYLFDQKKNLLIEKSLYQPFDFVCHLLSIHQLNHY